MKRDMERKSERERERRMRDIHEERYGEREERSNVND